MAEIEESQEPFSLSFQASSIHSGSISFGRFEKEGLSWEKRSSFSHNKYLEEVDKCSKPGSVTVMKAHFEAHFKKKGLRFPSSLESQTWGVHQTCEQDHDDDGDDGDGGVYDTESFEKCVEESYDEIVVNSDDVIELDEDNVEVSVEHISIEDVSCKEDLVGVYEIMPLEIEDRDGHEGKEDCTKRLEQDVIPTKALDVAEISSSASRPKPLEKIEHVVSVAKVSTKRHDDVTPKHVSRSTKSSLSSHSKTNADSKSRKESRVKKAVESQPMKCETRTPLATNRCKSDTSSSGFHFKCRERAEKRKEFYMKLEEKIHAKKTETNKVQAKKQQKAEAEMKQFRKSLNFRATPMPPFYNTNTKTLSQNKTETSKVAPPLRPRHTTSASTTNRVGHKHCSEEGKTLKVMIGSTRKQSAVKDSDMRKVNVMAVETKHRIGTRKSGN